MKVTKFSNVIITEISPLTFPVNKLGGENMENKNPLFLPAGSVRAIIALTAIIAVIVFVCFKIPIPDWYAVIAGSVIAYYFGNHTPIKPQP